MTEGVGARSGGEKGVFHGGMVAGEGNSSQWEDGSGGRRGWGIMRTRRDSSRRLGMTGGGGRSGWAVGEDRWGCWGWEEGRARWGKGGSRTTPTGMTVGEGAKGMDSRVRGKNELGGWILASGFMGDKLFTRGRGWVPASARTTGRGVRLLLR